MLCNMIEDSNMIMERGDKKLENRPPASPTNSKPKRETIQINYDNCSKGIGLQIIGGFCQNGEGNHGIFVKKLLPNGIAKVQGQLKVGDQLLKVNDNILDKITNERAIEILRRASESNRMELIVARDEKASIEFVEVFESNSNNSNNAYTNVSRNSVPSSPDSIGKYPLIMTGRANSSSPSPKPSTPTGNSMGFPFPSPGSPKPFLPPPQQFVSMGTVVPPPSPKKYSKPSSPLTTGGIAPFPIQTNTRATPPLYADTRATSPFAAETQATSSFFAETQATSPITADIRETSPFVVDTQATSLLAADTQATSPFVADTQATSPIAADIRATSPFVAETQATSPRVADTRATSPIAADTRATSPIAADIRATSPFVADTRGGSTPQPISDGQRMSPVVEEPARTPVSCLKSTDTTHAISSFDTRAGATTPTSNHSVKFSLDTQTISSSTEQVTTRAEGSRSPTPPKPSTPQLELPDVTSVGIMSPQSTTQVKVSSTPPFATAESPTTREATPLFSVANYENSCKTTSEKVNSPQVTSTVMTPQNSPDEMDSSWNSDYDFPDSYNQVPKYDKPFTYGIKSPNEISLPRSRVPVCVDYQMYPQPPLPKYEGWPGPGNYVREESQEEVAEFQENESKTDDNSQENSAASQTPPSTDYSYEEAQDDGNLLSNNMYAEASRVKMKEMTDVWQCLGFQPTPQELGQIRASVTVDENGMVSYDEVIRVAHEVCQVYPNGTEDMISQAVHREMEMSPQPKYDMDSLPDSTILTAEEASLLRMERDVLQIEVEKLRAKIREKEDTCNTAEEELLRIRREAQGAIHESRSLRSKVHLAEEAQKAARNLEQGYGEAIRILEKEIVQLKTQLNRQPKNSPIQRQLAVAACQLRKVESSKKTYEVAVDKLLKFVEHVQEVLEGNGNPFNNKQSTTNNQDGGAKSSKLKKTSATKVLANEAKDLVRGVKLLIDSQPLPYGWEEAYTSDGIKYYINHINQTTTWAHPVTGTQQFTPSVSPPPQINSSGTSSSSNAVGASVIRNKAVSQPGPGILKEPKN